MSAQPRNELIFLKLGGSLITDKSKPGTANSTVIGQLAKEISRIRTQYPSMKLLLGHGSGSFGHVAAKKYGTREGVLSEEDWRGFAEVWFQASALNRLVMEHLHRENLPALAFPALPGAVVEDGKITRWELAPLVGSLENGLIPVVYGDVAFDEVKGGTILSTEDIFVHLARRLKPTRILIAGIEEGVWKDYPTCTELIPEITPGTWDEVMPAIRGSAVTDVTGGMAAKVFEILKLVRDDPNLEVVIFSAKAEGALRKVFAGEKTGTRLVN